MPACRSPRAQSAAVSAQQAAPHHLVETKRQSIVERRAVGGREHETQIGGLRGAAQVLVLLRRDRSTGQLDDFERALDALTVTRLDAMCGIRIARRQIRVQGRPAFRRRARIQPAANFRIRRRQPGEP